MCGICGQLSWNNSLSKDTVSLMRASLKHRGPDGQGISSVGPVIFGHTRLAVIAPGHEGRQPMKDISSNYLLTFNGEIYNYIAIRNKLKKLGIQFRTNTDSEVLLEAYKYWDIDFLLHINGMFALAIWDSNKNKLILARDRLGKKPLHYLFKKNGDIYFASEAKALYNLPEFDRKINYKALNQYLNFGYILQSDSIFASIKKLPAASYLIFENNKPHQLFKYWKLEEAYKTNNSQINESELSEEFQELMDDSIKLRSISDVPVGVFLSGGLDSASVLESYTRNSNKPVNSFTIDFNEKSFSELNETKVTAKFFNSQLHIKKINAFEIEDLNNISLIFDEPFSDTSSIPTYELSKYAKEYVKVCLSGDGGDELFGGYETYIADKLYKTLNSLPAGIVAKAGELLTANLTTGFSKNSQEFKVKRFINAFKSNYNPSQAHFSWRSIFTKEEVQKLVKNELQFKFENDILNELHKSMNIVEFKDYINTFMYIDINTWLLDDILVKVDRASMANGLEVRSPFLDHRIVEFSARVPSNLKIKNFCKKSFLKRSQKNNLPSEILKRKKRGFSSPVSQFVNNKLFTNLILSSDSFAKNIFDTKYLKLLFDEHENHIKDHGLKIFNLINLELWAKNYNPIL